MMKSNGGRCRRVWRPISPRHTAPPPSLHAKSQTSLRNPPLPTKLGRAHRESKDAVRHIRIEPNREGGSKSRKELDPMLERRFQMLKRKLQEGGGYLVGHAQYKDSILPAYGSDVKGKKTNRKISWADHNGDSLISCCFFEEELPPSSIVLSNIHPVTSDRRCKGRVDDHRSLQEPLIATETLSKRTYKEVLLTTPPSLRSNNQLPTLRPRYKAPPRSRCFRCLARDHRIHDCRDPFRCAACFGIGHRAHHGHTRSYPRPPMMHRALGFRPPTAKIFISLTEGFHARQQQRQNAVLAKVIVPADLGHFPQGMIVSDFANCYGGFPNDFHVARHNERDFVIFLPQWVRPADQIGREILRFSHCRLRCYA